MAAHVEHEFERGFLLDEEKLRKLVNIIDQRLSKSNPPVTYIFRVFRADSYTYETDNIEDVINEDHSDWRRITELQIEASQNKEFEFKLMFSNEGTSLNVIGNDRDQVYLLLSDLRDYLKHEVNTCTNISQKSRRVTSAILPMIILYLFMSIFLWKTTISNKAEIQNALDYQEIKQKLDYLIKYRTQEFRFVVPMLILFPFVMILSATAWMDKLITFFFPANLFLFGFQKQKYERRRRIFTNVIWGILIAFGISVLAGLAVWKMTK